MAQQDRAIKQPVNDLTAFDLSRRSPEEIARLFARWKERRRGLQQAPARAGRPPRLRPMPTIVQGSRPETASEPEGLPDPPPHDAPAADKAGPISYSESFAALLAARAEPLIEPRTWNPDIPPPKVAMSRPPRRRSKMKWVLAGTASIFAVTAIAGGTLWRQGTVWRPAWMQASSGNGLAVAVADPVQAEVRANYSLDIPAAAPFAVVATRVPSVQASPLQRTIDVALMKPAAPVDAARPVTRIARLPVAPRLKPPVPVMQTASTSVVAAPAAAQKLAPIAQSAFEIKPFAVVSMPVLSGPDTEPSNAGDFPSAGASAPVPAEPEQSATHRTRSATISQGGNGNANVGSPHIGYSTGSPQAPTRSGTPSGGGSTGGAEPGGGTGGSDDGGSGTGGDPSGGDTGGGGDPGGGDTGGGDTGGGDTGSGGGDGGSGGGGDTGGDSGAGGSGGGDSGGGGSGGSDSGGGDSGGGDSGGGSGSGDSGGGDSGSGGGSGGGDTGGGDAGGGDSGAGDTGDGSGDGGSDGNSNRGGLGGALGGIRGALGGVLGGS
ncbi:MAG TPA: hypothetical protein VGQ35_10250 [Dongiaceae bacterium]|nr:hypothetical protein [Dongiaceae bacterium]